VSRVGRLEPVLVLLGGLVTLSAYAWAGSYWVEATDEGYFLSLASRVRSGQLPYRDFDTYYTPGIFYVYAAVFEVFGVGVLPIRILVAAVRATCILLLYGLTRRVAPWPFAVLPPLALAAVDAVPILPEPHPAWPALVGTLLAIEGIARHQASGAPRWLALAGAAAGAAFLFKQNVGAFAALGVAAYVLLRRRERAGRLLLGGRALFAIGLALAVTSLLRPALDPLLATALWLPLLVTLGFLLWSERDGARPACWIAGLRPAAVEGALAGAAFLAVTLAWLVPLVAALGPGGVPFGLFVGDVKQGALTWPLEPPPRAARELALAAIWLPLALAALRRGRAEQPGWAVFGVAGAASLLLPVIPTRVESQETLYADPAHVAWLTALDVQFGSLYLYLPALAAWGGLAGLLAHTRRGAPPGPLPWYLLGGTLAALAFYPRSDTPHALFAGPPLFVVGAWALSRAHRALATTAGSAGRRVVLFASLLVVPVAAVAPHVAWRYVTLTHAGPGAPEPPWYVPLGLERAQVLAPRHIAENIRGAVEFVRAGTGSGEPFFAYPAVPLFYFLADRPNPTRFDHVLPGALTVEEMAETIAGLETARPRYVLWDEVGVVDFRTDPANRPLSDYIWRCYGQVANFPPYLVLERREC
jgi:hypothetical protein